MKRSKYPLAIALAVPVGMLLYWLLATSRAMTRSPRYKVVLKEDGVEVRDYPHLTLANAPMGGDGRDGTFRTLFRYITGANARSEKIAMTTPVLIAPANGDAGNRTMGFIMPQTTVVQSAPKPLDRSVSLADFGASRLAVMSFAGARCEANESKAIERLEAWLHARGIPASGSPLIAYYDPSWTPVFLRRNEVMIPVSR